MSVSTVFNSGYLEMTWRITRKASPRHSWASGRRASRRSAGQSRYEQGGWGLLGPRESLPTSSLELLSPGGQTGGVAASSCLSITVGPQVRHSPSLSCRPGQQRPDLGLGSPAQNTCLIPPESMSSDHSAAASRQPTWPLPCPSPSGLLEALSSSLHALPAWALGLARPLSQCPLAAIPQGWHCRHPHFADEETEAQRGESPCQGS